MFKIFVASLLSFVLFVPQAWNLPEPTYPLAVQEAVKELTLYAREVKERQASADNLYKGENVRARLERQLFEKGLEDQQDYLRAYYDLIRRAYENRYINGNDPFVKAAYGPLNESIQYLHVARAVQPGELESIRKGMFDWRERLNRFLALMELVAENAERQVARNDKEIVQIMLLQDEWQVMSEEIRGLFNPPPVRALGSTFGEFYIASVKADYQGWNKKSKKAHDKLSKMNEKADKARLQYEKKFQEQKAHGFKRLIKKRGRVDDSAEKWIKELQRASFQREAVYKFTEHDSPRICDIKILSDEMVYYHGETHMPLADLEKLNRSFKKLEKSAGELWKAKNKKWKKFWKQYRKTWKKDFFFFKTKWDKYQERNERTIALAREAILADLNYEYGLLKWLRAVREKNRILEENSGGEQRMKVYKNIWFAGGLDLRIELIDAARWYSSREKRKKRFFFFKAKSKYKKHPKRDVEVKLGGKEAEREKRPKKVPVMVFKLKADDLKYDSTGGVVLDIAVNH